MKKIGVIGQFPPPIHGLSKALDTLYNSYLSEEFQFKKIDITNNKSFLKNLFIIMKTNADLFYLTISQTKGGNFRDLIILKLLDIKGKKCIIHLHGGYYRKLVDNDMSYLQRKLNYLLIKNLEGAIVLSESLKSIFSGMIDKNKIYVVTNCVDNEFLMSETDFKEKIKVTNQKQVKDVLYLSNFIRSKGYLEVLNLAKIEKKHYERDGNRRFHFHFAGKFFDNKEKNFFLEYIDKYNLHDYISYYGVVEGNSKKQLLKQCDIFILLTRYPNEGQPISILEAMANGMVVITTDHAGIPDIIEHGDNGIIIKRNIELESIFNEMCSWDSNYFYEVQQRNYNKVLEEFLEENYLQNMMSIFKKI